MSNSKELTRIDEEMKKLMEEIQVKRISEGYDKKMISSRRISKAMAKHPLVKGKVAEDIIRLPREEELK